MKIDINELKAAWEIVNGVDTASGIASSQTARLVAKGGMLEMSLEGLCSGRSSCPTDDLAAAWTWYVDRRVISAFLSASKGKTVSLDRVKDSLIMRCGRQKITVVSMADISGYSDWDPSASNGTFTLKLSEDFAAELLLHSRYAAKEDDMAAICLEKGYGMLSSDSFAVNVEHDKGRKASYKIPSLLAGFLSAKGAKEVLIEKNGAGVRWPNGWLYQPLPVNCVAGYPLKRVATISSDVASAKPLVKIAAKALSEALASLKPYAFGGTDLHVRCLPSKTDGRADLFLDTASGSAQTGVDATWGDPSTSILKWPFERLLPWVDHVAAGEPNIPISCGEKDGLYAFTVKGKKHRVLVIAGAV